MKVLLISSNITGTPYAIYPLGLSMVAAALKRGGHEVRQFDFFHHNRSRAAVARAIRAFRPDVVGISIRNIDNVNYLHEERYIDHVKKIAETVKQTTQAPVVLGGSGFSLLPEEILREVGADYGIVGEGESLMCDFVSGVKRGEYPAQRCIRTTVRLTGKDIPSADYDPPILHKYLRNGNMASVQTKRGCVHTCIYCSYPFLEGSTLRCRNPQAVVDDIQLLVETHGAKYIFFTDSVFNDDRQHFLDVVREMKQRGLYVPWTAFFKPTGLDDEMIALMKETGLKAAEIGADASTDVTLQAMGKTFRFRDIEANNELMSRHGIATAHYYMFGGPGETEATVREGIENISNLTRTVSFIYLGIRILPHTILAEMARREGEIAPDQELLQPVYYIQPGLDREWLEKTLTAAFSKIRHCVFPPDYFDSSVRFLHKLGYSGSLWEMLLEGDRNQARHRQNGNA